MRDTEITTKVFPLPAQQTNKNGQHFQISSRLLRLDTDADRFTVERMVPGRQSQTDILDDCHVLDDSLARSENHEKVSKRRGIRPSSP